MELLFYLVTSRMANRLCRGPVEEFALEFQVGGFVPDEQVPKSPFGSGQVPYNQQLGRVISAGGALRVQNGFLTNGG
jgi:hypothetical protein